MKLIFSISVVLTCVAALTQARAQPMLQVEGGNIRVIGLASKVVDAAAGISQDQWRSILPVYTREAYVRNIDQPIAGTYTFSDQSIEFEPEYPFSPGQAYHAIFFAKIFLAHVAEENHGVGEKFELSFSIPEKKFPVTHIQSVYPQSSALPENLLRMYIYFSAPMMPGEAFDHISLITKDGTPVEKAFLIIDQELWDNERKRFTLLFDPGRIKRDLKSNVELGPPLRDGTTYHLLIDSAWRDVHGNALGRSVVKTFVVTRPERSRLSVEGWDVIPPLAGSLESVILKFDRAIDHALALKYITIHSPSASIDGKAQMLDDSTWTFTPSHFWIEGEYFIQISPLLEDVAGNNLNNAFDLDLSAARRKHSIEPIRLQFKIAGIAR